MPTKAPRASNLELLRILCMLLIIGDHLTGQGGIADYSTRRPPSCSASSAAAPALPAPCLCWWAAGLCANSRSKPAARCRCGCRCGCTPCRSRCCAGWPGWMFPSAHCAGRHFPPVRASCGSSRTIWCCCSACRCSTGCCTGCPAAPTKACCWCWLCRWSFTPRCLARTEFWAIRRGCSSTITCWLPTCAAGRITACPAC